jgi:hypothetical protein
MCARSPSWEFGEKMKVKFRFCNRLPIVFRAAGSIVLLSLLMPGALSLAQAKTGKPSLTAAAAPTRIHFRPGAISTQVRGQLDHAGHASYVIKVDQGDHLIVNIVGLGGLATEGTIAGPADQGGGSHGGLVYSEDVTTGGDFTIRIDPNQMADSTPGARSFILEVVVTPAYLKK